MQNIQVLFVLLVPALFSFMTTSLVASQINKVYEKLPDIYLREKKHFPTNVKINLKSLASLIHAAVRNSTELTKICETLSSDVPRPCDSFIKACDSRISYVLGQIRLFYNKFHIPEANQSRIFPFYNDRYRSIDINSSYSISFPHQTNKTWPINLIDNFDIFQVLKHRHISDETKQRFELTFIDYDDRNNKSYSLVDIRALNQSHNIDYNQYRYGLSDKKNWAIITRKFIEIFDMIETVFEVILSFQAKSRYGSLDQFVLNALQIDRNYAELKSNKIQRPNLDFYSKYSRTTSFRIDYETGYFNGLIETPLLIRGSVYKTFNKSRDQSGTSSKIFAYGVDNDDMFQVASDRFERACSLTAINNIYLCPTKFKGNSKELENARFILMPTDFENCTITAEILVHQQEKDCEFPNKQKPCKLHCHRKKKELFLNSNNVNFN